MTVYPPRKIGKVKFNWIRWPRGRTHWGLRWHLPDEPIEKRLVDGWKPGGNWDRVSINIGFMELRIWNWR